VSAVPGVRRATGADVGALVAMLVRAFDDDPVPMFLFDGDGRRRRSLRRFFTAQLQHGYLETGEVWTTTDLAGAALWAPPTKPRPGWRDLVRLVPILPAIVASHGAGTGAALRFLAEVDAARPRAAHWYLATLGTEPSRQGQGIGSALLAAVLRRVDEEGSCAYLESSKERNVPFYARHGFEVTGEITAPGGGPTLWLMWRDPRPPG